MLDPEGGVGVLEAGWTSSQGASGRDSCTEQQRDSEKEDVFINSHLGSNYSLPGRMLRTLHVLSFNLQNIR